LGKFFRYVMVLALFLGCTGSFELLEILINANDLSTSTDAADFSLTTFDGEQIALSDFHGSVVVVNFWASWCAPCMAELPILESLSQRYQDDGVVFIGIATYDYAPAAIDFINEYDVSYLTGSDSESTIADAYRVIGIPETFIIDQQGKVFAHIVAGFTEDQFSEMLDTVLADSAKSSG